MLNQSLNYDDYMRMLHNYCDKIKQFCKTHILNLLIKIRLQMAHSIILLQDICDILYLDNYLYHF